MKFKILISLAIIIGIGVLCGVLIYGTENRAVSMEEQISTSESNMNSVLKKRNDLILQLAQVVERYAENEKEILISVAEARAKLVGGDAQQAQVILAAVAEQYPEIKQGENYMMFQKEIATVENQILRYRESFNTQVRAYNRLIRTKPWVWFLGIAGYEFREYKYLEFKEQDLEVNTNIFGK